MHALNVSRKRVAPPCEGCRTYGASSAASAMRPTASTRRPRASSRANGKPASTSGRVGALFAVAVPGCVGDDVPEEDGVRKLELGKYAVNDGRGRLPGRLSGELPLGREGDARDARA